MIRAMRSSAKWIMGVLVVAFVGWMVFDVGMGITGGGGYRPGDAIAEVNGQRIDLQVYNNAVRDAQDRQRQQAGSAPVTREDLQALESAVLENLIQGILLRDEYRRRGITVSDDEIRAAALQSPPPEVQNIPEFQTEGRFDLSKYQRYVNSRQDPTFLLALEARYRDEIPQAKLLDQLVADIYLTDARLWQVYRDQHDSVTIRLLTLFPDAAVPDSEVRIADSEVEHYYQDHTQDFDRRAVAYLSYVVVPQIPIASDSAAARQRALDLRQEIVKGGDFAEIAKRESADTVSGARGGDLGEAKKGAFVPEFEHAALALSPGQTSQPVLSPFGYHIIKLESKKGDTYHARHILIPIQLAGAHQDEVDAKIDSLERRAADQSDGALLDSAAAAIGARVLPVPPLLEGERAMAGATPVSDAGIWAFEARTGETSPVIESGQASYVFRLDSLLPGGVPPLTEIRDLVAGTIRLKKKLEATRQIALGVVADIRAGRTTLDSAAKRFHGALLRVGPFNRVSPPTGLQAEPALVGAAFGTPMNGVSPPVAGERAVYLVQPLSRHPADSAAFAQQLPAEREQMLQLARQARVRLVMNSLRAQAKVEDRRKALAEAQRKAEQAQELQNARAGARPSAPQRQ
jgi:peptidyl-prolyl cis-trans isomerase D